MTQPTMLNTRNRREMLLQKRAEEIEYGYELNLPDASEEMGEPFAVRVRKLRLGERAAYTGISEELSRKVQERTKDYADLLQRKVEGESVSAYDAISLVADPGFVAVVNAVCLAAFIDPPLVETEEEQSGNPDAWLVSDFSFGDRIHVFNALQAPDSKEAQSMTRFRPESSPDVETGAVLQDVQPAAKRRAGNARGRKVGGNAA